MKRTYLSIPLRPWLFLLVLIVLVLLLALIPRQSAFAGQTSRVLSNENELLVSFIGHLDTVGERSIVVNGTEIFFSENYVYQPQIDQIPEYVSGTAWLKNQRLALVSVAAYSAHFDGIVETITVPDQNGEYFITLNGLPYLIGSYTEVTGGRVIEGARVLGVSGTTDRRISSLTVVPPFPLDLFTRKLAYPWPLYAAIVLWLPVIFLIFYGFATKTRAAVAAEESEITDQAAKLAVQLDEAELAEEAALQREEADEELAQQAFGQLLDSLTNEDSAQLVRPDVQEAPGENSDGNRVLSDAAEHPGSFEAVTEGIVAGSEAQPAPELLPQTPPAAKPYKPLARDEFFARRANR